jgi:translocator protein
MALERELYADDAERMIAHQRRAREAVVAERELYAEDARHMIKDQRRHRSERRRRRRGGVSPWTALAIAGGAVALSALIGRRYSPEPAHPAIDRWYHDLDKPSYTPPDPVFGCVWPMLEVLLAVGGYRLLRAPPGPDRDTALALWAFNIAMIGGWTKLFFGERSLAGGSLAAAGMLASSAAYVEFARRVDGWSGAAGVPFTAWLAFATLLSEEIWRRNPE